MAALHAASMWRGSRGTSFGNATPAHAFRLTNSSQHSRPPAARGRGMPLDIQDWLHVTFKVRLSQALAHSSCVWSRRTEAQFASLAYEVLGKVIDRSLQAARMRCAESYQDVHNGFDARLSYRVTSRIYSVTLEFLALIPDSPDPNDGERIGHPAEGLSFIVRGAGRCFDVEMIAGTWPTRPGTMTGAGNLSLDPPLAFRLAFSGEVISTRNCMRYRNAFHCELAFPSLSEQQEPYREIQGTNGCTIADDFTAWAFPGQIVFVVRCRLAARGVGRHRSRSARGRADGFRQDDICQAPCAGDGGLELPRGL